MYKSEAEFLKKYNPDEFEKLSVTTDILIFSVSDERTENYRKLNKKHFSVLMVKRKNHPYKDKWCLPGGFININEDLEEAPKRILALETNLKDIYLEQLYTFGEINRDPRMRILSVSYMSLIDKNLLEYKLANQASWFNMNIIEDEKNISIVLENGKEILKINAQKSLKHITSNRFDYEITKNEGIAFDHARIIVYGIDRLKNKIKNTDIVFNMMPKYFTLGELQKVYEVILGKKLLDPAFRRIIADKVEKTDELKTGGGHRPAALFKYRK